MIAGGCRCGACRYELATDRLPPTYCCHCLHCQTWSGSAFTMQGIAREGALTATGPITTFEMTNPSGATSTQHGCSVCHTRLWNTNTARPGLALIRAGTLDDSGALVPRAHIWTSRRQTWLTLDAAIPHWPQNAPPEELMRALLGHATQGVDM